MKKLTGDEDILNILLYWKRLGGERENGKNILKLRYSPKIETDCTGQAPHGAPLKNKRRKHKPDNFIGP